MTPSDTAVNRTAMPKRGLPLVAGTAGVVLGMTVIAVVLWFHYGTAVFYEVFLAGIANCF